MITVKKREALNAYTEIYKKQHYGLVGSHSAVKVCHWTKSELTGGPGCYKGDFYGIQSHRCIQMTPALNACTENCSFCWRFQGFDSMHISYEDDPEFILEESIRQHKKLLSGFKGNPKVSEERWKEAMEPKHIAISLTGEPTLYSRLGEFIELAHRRGMTTFLVTNGTLPMVLEKLDPLPTQLYVTVAAPNEKIFKELLSPAIGNGWQNLMRTLELLPSLDTRKVIRHTLVKGVNMPYVDEYARLDMIGMPDFIEPKGYVHVGQSIARLGIENMPSHADIMDFSRALAERTGYQVAGERSDSRVALLARDPERARIRVS
ncbi:4-demethylwyosine synthase TYW1 [Thermogymnomonas acidicola]|uniref:S-adenosyl-L-methionine-dependent tRNA 4-demethylwyosine synthase n=1 Tax=Thermogymnomonas acidicola TaxID=399579 RepID=A0AA37BQY1_9ARCH|nr:4-demethylwyosine synthase TYW1 [Thermogymnomonas acidicola]GGM71701.1 4-demethylwyosine synthase TYW1 [Thermogymnomonas acidicola]